MQIATARKTKPYKGVAMEGMIATWYAKNTAGSLAEFRDLAKRVAAELRPGDRVLEIAPGPGYFAVELARLGPYRVTGLDISHSFVRIAVENAARAGVDVDFHQGDAAALPFAAKQFEFVLCRAAFKNFGDPLGSLCEMHRVLRPGGTALIVDLRNNASDEAIAHEVKKMNLNRIGEFITKTTLRSLRKRAYSKSDFDSMLRRTPFRHGEILEHGIGFELRLTKAVN
jgi:ubiquinone/menaquinone biosynthesis C-methylase UbiE